VEQTAPSSAPADPPARRRWPFLLLFLGLVLLAGFIACLVLHLRGGEDEEEEPSPKRPGKARARPAVR
jgi:hypothetical protein